MTDDADRLLEVIVLLPEQVKERLTRSAAVAFVGAEPQKLTASQVVELAARTPEKACMIVLAEDRLVQVKVEEPPTYIGRIIPVNNITQPSGFRERVPGPPKLTRDQIRGPRRGR